MKRSKKKVLLKTDTIYSVIGCDAKIISDFDRDLFVGYKPVPIPDELMAIINHTSIHSFINSVYHMLDIKKRPVFFIAEDYLERNSFGSGSQKGCFFVHHNNHFVLLRKGYENKLTLFRVLAHELRHIWQKEHGLLPAPEEIIPRENMSPTQYNMQSFEIDAEAFSYFIMMFLFKVGSRSSDSIINSAIQKRVIELYKWFDLIGHF